MRSLAIRAAIAALCAVTLTGCIDSADPILTDAQPVFGQRLKLQFFTLRKGFAHDPEQATFNWNGALYAHASGGMRDVSAFSVHPFEAGDYIIQDVPARHPRISEYALLHKIADGVYQVLPIDEADADEADPRGLLRQRRQDRCLALPYRDARSAVRLCPRHCGPAKV